MIVNTLLHTLHAFIDFIYTEDAHIICLVYISVLETWRIIVNIIEVEYVCHLFSL